MRFDIVVQPPGRARPNKDLDPPLVLCLTLSPQGYLYPNHFSATVTLVDELSNYGIENVLEGILSMSAQPISEGQAESSQHGASQEKWYFCFKDLSIKTPGRYRLNISLTQWNPDTEGFYFEQDAESCIITVAEQILTYSRPSKKP